MKITFCFGGKKRFAAALLAAAMALFLFFGCSSGGDDGPGEIPQGSGTNQGGGQNPSEGENQGGESGGGESEEGGNNNPSYSDLKEFFEKNYEDEFKGVTQSTSITLTAQTIKDVVEKTPTFETDAKAIGTLQAENNLKVKLDELDSDVRKAIMAQAKGYLIITKESNSRKGYQYNSTSGSYGSDIYPLSSVDYKISTNNFSNLSLSGEFDFDKEYIKLLSNNIDISKVEILSNGKSGNYIIGLTTKAFKELCDDLNLSKEIDISKWPKLNFVIGLDRKGEFGLKYFLDIYEKYNTSAKIQQITGTFKSLDGSELVDNSSNYTLFDDDNTAKTSGTENVKSMNINTLVNFSEKYNTEEIKNIIGRISSFKRIYKKRHSQ